MMRKYGAIVPILWASTLFAGDRIAGRIVGVAELLEGKTYVTTSEVVYEVRGDDVTKWTAVLVVRPQSDVNVLAADGKGVFIYTRAVPAMGPSHYEIVRATKDSEAVIAKLSQAGAAFKNVDEGVYLESGKVVATRDGGKTWQEGPEFAAARGASVMYYQGDDIVLAAADGLMCLVKLDEGNRGELKWKMQFARGITRDGIVVTRYGKSAEMWVHVAGQLTALDMQSGKTLHSYRMNDVPFWYGVTSGHLWYSGAESVHVMERKDERLNGISSRAFNLARGWVMRGNGQPIVFGGNGYAEEFDERAKTWKEVKLDFDNSLIAEVQKKAGMPTDEEVREMLKAGALISKDVQKELMKEAEVKFPTLRERVLWVTAEAKRRAKENVGTQK